MIKCTLSLYFIRSLGSGDVSEGTGATDASGQGTKTAAVVHNAGMEHVIIVHLTT